MKSKIFALFFVGAAVGGVLGLDLSCYGTPANACFAAHGQYVVRYYPQAGTPTTGPCAPDPTGATGNPALYGELVGIEPYLGVPNGPGPDGGLGSYNGVEYVHPDYNHLTIALQSTTLANIAASGGDVTDTPISIATYGPLPNDAGICTAGTFNLAEQNIPAVTQADGGVIPAVDIQYQWSNFQMVSTTSVQGTQWGAQLVYTDKVNNCTGTYTAVGISPIIGCAACLCSDGTACDASGACTAPATPGTVPNNLVCNPEKNTDGGAFLGSGLDPLFPVFCDPNLFICTLVPQTAGSAPSVPDTSSGWFNTPSWLSDAGG
jgi:hypothetical protein